MAAKLIQGEEAYTDSPEYLFWKGLSENEPWIRGMRNLHPNYMSWTSRFAGSCSNLCRDMEMECLHMEAGLLPAISGLKAELEKKWHEAAELAETHTALKAAEAAAETEKTGIPVKGKAYTADLLMWIAGVTKLEPRYLSNLAKVKAKARKG
jgi:hypothetical protein